MRNRFISLIVAISIIFLVAILGRQVFNLRLFNSADNVVLEKTDNKTNEETKLIDRKVWRFPENINEIPNPGYAPNFACKNGSLYCTPKQDEIYKIDIKTGKVIWRYQFNKSTIKIYDSNENKYKYIDGTVYLDAISISPYGDILCLDTSLQNLFILNDDGTLKNTIKFEPPTSFTSVHYAPIYDSNGNIYVYTSSGWIYAFDRDYKTRWKKLVSSNEFGISSFALSDDNRTIYIAQDGEKGFLFALDVDNGKEEWKYSNKKYSHIWDLYTDGNGGVFISTFDDKSFNKPSDKDYTQGEFGAVIRIDSNGNEVWACKIPKNKSLYALKADRVRRIVYTVGGTDMGAELFAVSYEGKLLWDTTDKGYKFEVNWTHNGIQIDENGFVYLGGANNLLYKLDSNGNKIWDYQLEEDSTSLNNAIVYDRYESYLFCIAQIKDKLNHNYFTPIYAIEITN